MRLHQHNNGAGIIGQPSANGRLSQASAPATLTNGRLSHLRSGRQTNQSYMRLSWGAGVMAALALAVTGCSGSGSSESGGISSGGGGGGSTVAKVGRTSISDKQLLDYTESTPGGAQLLNTLILQAVVAEAAQDQKVSPTEADVNAEMADFQTQNAGNPQMADLIAKNKDAIVQDMRMQAAIDNLIKKDVDTSDAAKQAWFKSHKTLFDQAAKASLETYVFTDQGKAKSARSLLEKGSAASDVATLADSSFPGNGQASPPETEQQFTQVLGQLGPDVAKAIHGFYQPGAKPGSIAGPFSVNLPGMGKKFALLRVASLTPAKEATYEDSKKDINQLMPAEAYYKKHGGAALPANLPLTNFRQIVQDARSRLVRELMQQYVKDNKITINPPHLKDTLMKEYQPAPAAGAPGAPGAASGGAPGGGAPPMGGPAPAGAPAGAAGP